MITVAYRSGPPNNRSITATLRDPGDKGVVFAYVWNLKGLKNNFGKPYFVDAQLPEALRERRRRAKQIMAENHKQPPASQSAITYKKGQLTVDSEPYQQVVQTPTNNDILKMSEKE